MTTHILSTQIEVPKTALVDAIQCFYHSVQWLRNWTLSEAEDRTIPVMNVTYVVPADVQKRQQYDAECKKQTDKILLEMAQKKKDSGFIVISKTVTGWVGIWADKEEEWKLPFKISHSSSLTDVSIGTQLKELVAEMVSKSLNAPQPQKEIKPANFGIAVEL